MILKMATRIIFWQSDMEDSESDELMFQHQTSAKVPRLDFMDTDDEDSPQDR